MRMLDKQSRKGDDMDRDGLGRNASGAVAPGRRLHPWLAAALIAAFAGAVSAAEPPAHVDHARIRWLPGDLPLAGYFDLTNTGRHTFTLTGASSRAFGAVMMHRTVQEGGMARMLPVHDLKVRPGKTLHFAPEGYHLMLMQRTRPLAVGDHVPIRLNLADGRSLAVTFTVEGAGMQ
jgi:copper(I)-binding protein